MVRLLFAVAFLACVSSVEAAESGFTFVPDQPVELFQEPLEFDLETGRTFDGIQSVTIRMQGEVAANSVWYCIGAADYELFFSVAAVQAGIGDAAEPERLERRLLPETSLPSPGSYPPMLTLDETFVFTGGDWSSLDDGRVRVRVGPVDPGYEYDPCDFQGPGAGGWFRWLDVTISRVDVVVTSDAVVDGSARSFGAIKGLFETP